MKRYQKPTVKVIPLRRQSLLAGSGEIRGRVLYDEGFDSNEEAL